MTTNLQWIDDPRWLSEMEKSGHDIHLPLPDGQRKRLLFVCACCRELGSLMEEDTARQAVELLESTAEGGGDMSLCHLGSIRSRGVTGEWLREALQCAGRGNLREAVDYAARALRDLERRPNWTRARVRFLHFLYDLTPQPEDPRTVLDPAWLAWHGGLIPVMARTIYDERRFEDMPILADALEEAGCEDRLILDHCRGTGGRNGVLHARGCWFLDLVLGKD
jgi:hypothetical protein